MDKTLGSISSTGKKKKIPLRVQDNPFVPEASLKPVLGLVKRVDKFMERGCSEPARSQWL
jgi:hypothetical protein